ncbi:hypothetical protein AB1283_26175 [Bacillus sp. S13(2024)]|uniref:hypothetical protein n=1 Tax=Bacillus sp. S13(2024) TaxID=3162885 RepID=UPI003D1BE246
MKMYNAIEHLVGRHNGKKETRESNYIWNKNKDELINKVEKRIEEFHLMESRLYDIVSYDIIEREVQNETYEGFVSNEGRWEDFRVLVGDTEIEDVLHNRFDRLNVKVTIEVIE